MKKNIIIIILLVLLIILFFLYKNSHEKFYLDKEYYNNTSLIELDVNKFNTIINNKKSFAIFIYQPSCTTSDNFNKIVNDFSNKYQISFYKMSFINMNKTMLKDYIRYYPSFVIINNGKVIDFLDAGNNEHTKYYKSVDEFKNFISNYIKFRE